MGRKLRLKEVILGRAASFYTLHDVGQAADVAHTFFDREGEVKCTDIRWEDCRQYNNRCGARCFRIEYLADLYAYLYKVGPRRGFRFDDKKVLPHATYYGNQLGVVKSGPFRVYGLFLGDLGKPLFVATGGGYKMTQTIQEDPLLETEFEFAKACLIAFRRTQIGVEKTLMGTFRLTLNYSDAELKIK